ncbi:MAG TPA: DNA-binding response regulator [Bacteroidales bacterium]|nr:DNA-binding response regulator [Bacteroidales bacterium]
MNCIIVDDQPGSRQLEEYVSRCSSLNLVGKFNDPLTAIDQLSKQNNIGLAFIDLKSAGVSSLELIDSLNNPPSVIVMASTGRYARTAFDHNVVDYLITPVDYSRFSRAVDRSLKTVFQKSAVNNENREVFIKKESTLVKLKILDVVFVEALENYVTIVTGDKKYTILYTMKGIESQLPSEIFIRIHRSFIVNKKMIRTIYENSLDLNVGNFVRNFPIGKSYRSNLMNDITIVDKKALAYQNQYSNTEYAYNIYY